MFTLFFAVALIDFLLFVGVAWTVDAEFDPLSILFSVLAIALTVWLTGTNLFVAIPQNLGEIVAIVVGWFVVGTAWSTFKWYRYIKQGVNDGSVANDYASFLKSYPGKSYDDFLSSIFNDYRVSKNKGRIIRWIVYWPASMFWACTYRLVEWLATTIYNTIGDLYQWIASSVIKRALVSTVPTTEKKQQLNG